MDQISNKSVVGPKVLFWYLTLFFTLGLTAFAVGDLWFQFINKWVPQEVAYGMVSKPFSQSLIKFAIASLIISTPIFFLITKLIRKSLKSGSLAASNRVRSWITYIILFVTVAIAVTDLITTVFRVLDGDYTTRFLLKAATILVIVSWIFIYYWLELKSDNALTTSPLPKNMAIATVAIIVVSFVGSIFLIDSPATARSKAFDQTKVNNLSEIRYTIDGYYYENGKLPAALEDLTDYRADLQITDPQSQQPYEYKVIDQETFELCANFSTSVKENIDDRTYYSPEGFVYEPGRNCFTKKVNDTSKSVPIR